MIIMGLPESISSCIDAIYALIPAENARTIAIPTIPIEPAMLTISDLPFLDIRLTAERRNAVNQDIFAFSLPPLLRRESFFDLRRRSRSSLASCASSFAVTGLVSSTIRPSRKRIILVEYLSASSGLWVTIITSLSLAISFISSIICTEVAVSSAPVGSSARSISGSLTSARAIATLWH